MKTLKTPYQAGLDAGKNGANMINCCSKWFMTHEETDEWDRGNEKGKEMRIRKSKRMK